MIGRDYFKRQATTLRKMVSVTQDEVAAERLRHLADNFDAKANSFDTSNDQTSGIAAKRKADRP